MFIIFMHLIAFQGRSKSLTSIDALNPSLMDIEAEEEAAQGCSSDAAGDNRLSVPPRCDSAGPPVSPGSAGGFHRRRNG